MGLAAFGPAIFLTALFLFAATFMTDLVNTLILKIGSLFSFIDDLKQARQMSKDRTFLSQKEKNKLNKLENKLSRGKRLSKRQQRQYQMLKARETYGISENEYNKRMKSPESYENFSPVEKMAEIQEQDFTKDKQKELAKIDRVLSRIDEVLENPTKAGLSPTEVETLNNYRSDLTTYRSRVDGLTNDRARTHNQSIIDLARDAALGGASPAPTLTDLDLNTYETIKGASGIGNPPEFNDPTIFGKIKNFRENVSDLSR